MDAVKILIPFVVLMAAHIWAKRWTWCFVWPAVALLIGCAEILTALHPPLWIALLVSGAFTLVIWFCLFMAWKFNNKRTISKDIWALFRKGDPEYAPLKGWACAGSWLVFAVYLFLHFVLRW